MKIGSGGFFFEGWRRGTWAVAFSEGIEGGDLPRDGIPKPKASLRKTGSENKAQTAAETLNKIRVENTTILATIPEWP
jgi:hypothetical protein